MHHSSELRQRSPTSVEVSALKRFYDVIHVIKFVMNELIKALSGESNGETKVLDFIKIQKITKLVEEGPKNFQKAVPSNFWHLDTSGTSTPTAE